MATRAEKQLEDKLSLVNEKVKSNVTIVTPKEVGQDFMLHIAKKRFKELTPNISKRAGAKEDNTLTI